MMRFVRECDMFRKLPPDHRDITVPQSPVSLLLQGLAGIVMAVLLFNETSAYFYPPARQRFDLDMSETAGVGALRKVRVLLDITIKDFPCIDLSLDYQDVMGAREVDVKSTVFKQRLNKNGSAVGETLKNDPKTSVSGAPSSPSLAKGANRTNTTCMSCYGALPETECCNTCSDVLYAYRMKRWAPPRIEEVPQCKNDRTAETAYQPPQMIRLDDYRSDDFIPKFTKIGDEMKKSNSEARVSTPFTPMKLNFTFPMLKPLKYPLDRDSGTNSFAFQPAQFGADGKGDGSSSTTPSGDNPITHSWPGCIFRNLVMHGFHEGEALMLDLTKYGATSGCWDDDCTESDKFACETVERCSAVCHEVPSCYWWTWGQEEGVQKCWLRDGRAGREKRFGFASGHRLCADVEVAGHLTDHSLDVSHHHETDVVVEEGKKAAEEHKREKEKKKHDKEEAAKQESSSSSSSTEAPKDDGSTDSSSSAPAAASNSSSASSVSGDSAAKPTGDAESAAAGGSAESSEGAASSEETLETRRLSSWEDDGELPFLYGLGSGLHMPMFGYESKEKREEREMRKAMQGESCRIHGYFDVNKVPGNFHIGTHGPTAPSYLTMFGYGREGEEDTKNMQHIITHLAFVDTAHQTELKGRTAPLDGFQSPKAFTFQYYITLSPATIIQGRRKHQEGYQFRAGSFVTNELIGPAVFFRMDIDPIRVTYYDEETSFARYLVNVCAVVGGVYGLMSLLDGVLEGVVSPGKD
eukprot:TRINITY_DN74288_c0_g1_i1.p1 TRINITY_DN74288_c0_g1~~TRINITY_DN74288_c0_g1_i1.p1  ORF type:complete len:749 (-),score=182.39 TRINITY_DN74288_c0_g1_i1:32-2278(-)